MNSTALNRLALSGLFIPAAALVVSCVPLDSGTVEHGKVIDKRGRAPWTETVTEDVYNCRSTTTRSARSSLVIGKGGGSVSGGGGSRAGGGGLFGGGSSPSKPKPPAPKPAPQKPGPKGGGKRQSVTPGGKPTHPGSQQRRDCIKVGKRQVPKSHPGRYELHIKTDDGRTAWKQVTVTVYNLTDKGDTV